MRVRPTQLALLVSGLSLSALGAARSAGAPSVGQSGRYELDPSLSHLVIHVGKTGLLGFAGHEHAVRAGAIAGTVNVDGRDVQRSRVDVRFDVTALRVIDDGEPKGDAPKVQQAMQGPKCLDATRFPVIRFVSTGITTKHSSEGHYDLEIRGDLTLHGVTKPVTTQVQVEFSVDRLTARGRTTLRQTDWNIVPITVAGVVKVKNELDLEWSFVGRRS